MNAAAELLDDGADEGSAGTLDGAAVPTALAAFAIGQAVQINDGNIHPLGLAWIALAIVSLFAAIKGQTFSRLARLPWKWVIGSCLAIQWAELLVWGIHWRPESAAPIVWFALPLIISGIGAVAILYSRNLRAVGLGLLIAGHACAGAYVIGAIPKPLIDVWYFQQESSAALLHGQNPYEVRYRNIYDPYTSFYNSEVCVNGYLTCSYPYPPLPLLVATPARLLGDVRWAHLAALEGAALLIAMAATRRKAWLAAMLLLSPRSLLVIHAAWTEPMLIFFFAGVLYAARRRPRQLWLALGLLLAVKQYMILLLPLALLLPSVNWRVLLKSIATAAAITLPFMLWNPIAFFRSVVMWQLIQPFRIDSLSFAAMVAQMTGWRSPSIVALLAAGMTLIWTFRRAPRSAAGFSVAAALVLMIFFAFGKQAFCNYYFGAIGFCCGAVAVMETRRQSSVQSRSPTLSSQRLAA